MARAEKVRRVGCGFEGHGFKPIGRPVSELDVEVLRADELEALRLADLEGLYQESAACRMGVSRATFARILGRARTTVARALLGGRVLVFGEGPVVKGSAEEPLPCPVHGRGARRGRSCRCPEGEGSWPVGPPREDDEETKGGS